MTAEQEQKKEFSLEWLDGVEPSKPKKPAKVVWVDGKAISADDGFRAPLIETMDQPKRKSLTAKQWLFLFLAGAALLGFFVGPKRKVPEKNPAINDEGIANRNTFPAFEGGELSKELVRKLTDYKLTFPWKQPTVEDTGVEMRIVRGTAEAGPYEWDWYVAWQWQDNDWVPTAGSLGPHSKQFNPLKLK